MSADPASRRKFLHWTSLAAAGGFAMVAAPAHALAVDQPVTKEQDKEKEKEKQSPDEEVSPAEDLMREHGVFKRILLVYGEGVRRIDANQDLPPDPILDAAKLVRSFVEDYHEKFEENFLFPRFRMANMQIELVDVLTVQHQAGRTLIDITIKYANLSSLRDSSDKRQLRESMAEFIRMYRPHEAREDTVLFPAFRTIVSANEYDSLGEDFEKKEHELFGDDGFEKMVGRVATIEKVMGIYDLAQFTPKV